MRIAILSDIHGNQLALDAVLTDLGQQPPVDQLVIAGDLCLNGPQPREVVETVQGLRCPVVQGNVDVYVTRQTGRSEKKRAIIAWTREQIGPQGIDYLDSLPFSYRVENPRGSALLVVHANPLNLDDALEPDSDDSALVRLLGGLPPDIGALAFGHLHIAYQRRWRNLLLVNAGSCGIPRDGDTRASYAILTWQDDTWRAEHRRVDYDMHEVIRQLKTCGIPYAEKLIRIVTEANYS